jgi:hypothetical protein
MIPTTVGIVAIDRMDVEEPSGFPLTSSPPLLYQFGHHSPSSNLKVFKQIVSHIGAMAQKREDEDAAGKFLSSSSNKPNDKTLIFTHALKYARVAGLLIQVLGQKAAVRTCCCIVSTFLKSILSWSSDKNGFSMKSMKSLQNTSHLFLF